MSHDGVTHVPDEVSAGVVAALQVAVETSATNIKELKEAVVQGLEGLHGRISDLEADKIARDAVELDRAKNASTGVTKKQLWLGILGVIIAILAVCATLVAAEIEIQASHNGASQVVVKTPATTAGS